MTLNRPQAKNAIDPEMDARLVEVWREFERDDEVDVAVWTGAGDSFCAGADRNTWGLRWLGATALTVRDNVAAPGFGGLTRGSHWVSKPVIAAVNGWALGGGFELALACDIRIAGESARFGLPLVRFGFHTGDGGIARLINIAGLGVALELQLIGEPIGARQALEWHLVTRVVPDNELLDSALALARQIAENDQLAVRSAKQTTLELIGRPLDDQLRIEALNGYSMAARTGEIMAAFQADAAGKSAGERQAR